MSVGLLIITHARIGLELLNTAESMLGMCPLQTECIEVPSRYDPDALYEHARRSCQDLDKGDGVLVLTDMFGSTPSNVANRLRETENVQVVAGINLPMLVRVLNYPSLNLHKMVAKALSGGHDGILHCEAEEI